MRRTEASGLLVACALAALVVAGGGLGSTAEPAAAAFPGTNGRIAFVSDRTTGPGVRNPTGDQEIFTMNPDGSGLKQLTRNTARDEAPTWSPDGTKLAFVSDRDGDLDVYTMRADGADQKNLSFNPGQDFDPAWSPDGRSIAFRSNRDGKGEIYTMRPGGTKQTRLTTNRAYDIDPDWQPKPR